MKRIGDIIPPCFTPLETVKDGEIALPHGVKQGRILRPILFNVYIDAFSVSLNSSNIGRQIGSIFLNHLCYTDDHSVFDNFIICWYVETPEYLIKISY